MNKLFFRSISFVIAFLGIVVQNLLLPSMAYASGPSHTRTVMIGSSVVDIMLSQDPPSTDQPFEVTVVPHDHTLHLSGQVIAKPGLGTDAANIYASLAPRTGDHAALGCSLRLPVRGAWQIVVELNGPQGQHSASIDIVAAAPGAMPTWLDWLIGSIPALGLLWWTLRQFAYQKRRKKTTVCYNDLQATQQSEGIR